MGLIDRLKTRREDILRIAAKHGARNIRVFGSVARGEARENSDVDFLVEMEKGRSLFDRAALLVELEEFLACKVDVATERTLKPAVLERVLRDVVTL
ncbi:MAG: nucleotidyltransferase family protein [Acidobacteria bacterium]|nr:nucleotidyltransferase family protein [Acidobacteriota bacterium]MBI3657106.1 nucleotidyltransferase family protein [Acidobacteriota bacterium]